MVGGIAGSGRAQELAGGDVDKIDPAAEDRLAVVEFSPKDNAFELRYPQGWVSDSGARPDDAYSWSGFTMTRRRSGSTRTSRARMSGSDSAQPLPEGGGPAPVHRARRAYKKAAAEELSDFKERSPPSSRADHWEDAGSQPSPRPAKACSARSGGVIT